jgi:hypothetical protein
MSTYPATALLPQNGSIVSRWLLDESGTGTRADIVGTNTLSNSNSVTNGAGYTAPGATFDNSADYEASSSMSLFRGDNASLSITGNMAISMFVKLESAPSSGNNMAFLSKIDFGSANSYLFAYVNTGGTFFLDFTTSSNGSNLADAQVTQTLTLGTWYHLVMVYTAAAGSAAFYLNGTQTGTTQTGLHTSIFDSGAEFDLGRTANSASYYDGLMQDAILWNTTLTSGEASSLYTLYQTSSISGGKIFMFNP